MDWRRLERWAIIATIALYAAAALSLFLILGETLLPEGSPIQQASHNIANHLTRLGEIGGGVVIVVVLSILVGGGIGMLFLRAYDKYQENKQRRERERAQWMAEAMAEGRAEGRAEILEQLRDRGINVDDLLPPSEPSYETPAAP